MKIQEIASFKYPYHNLLGIGERIKRKCIYKYMPISTAEQCLRNNNIRFQEPSQWKDPFERLYYTAIYNNVMPDPAFDTRIYACCFTSNKDCEAAWHMYTDNIDENPCVEFKIHLGQFRKFAEKQARNVDGSLYEGCVNYQLKDDEILHLYRKTNPKYRLFFQNFNKTKYLNLLLMKRKFFQYEGEIRYIIQSPLFDFAKSFYYVTIPWSLCLYSVTLPPNCSKDIKKRIDYALKDNYNLCRRDFPLYFPAKVPILENTLEAPLTQIVIE